jgi:hypothetical protein
VNYFLVAIITLQIMAALWDAHTSLYARAGINFFVALANLCLLQMR